MTMAVGTTDPTESQQASDSSLPKKHDISALNLLYVDGDSIDTEVFAEMRSNILLISGEHYNRRQSNFYKRIRDSRELSQEQKIRLTKNHIQNIVKIYVNNIISHRPGIGFSPRREDDLHDQKMTELNDKLWRDAFQKYDIDDKQDDWCDNFVGIGETAVKIFYDPDDGDITGYHPLLDDNDTPILNQFQQMIPDEDRPKFSGRFIFEELYGFNILRPSECKDMRQAEWLCIRKMANKEQLKAKFAANPEVQKYIVTSSDETYVVFDGSKGSYRKTKNQCMLREYYFRPCALYPRGYFYITTKEGILMEGELPGGVFPIIISPYDRIQTTPRGRGPVKHMRPYQAEINRTGSKIAEHQITLGDDKLLLPNGAKISAGAQLPGVRSVSYTGGQPTILAGRAGDQYTNSLNSQIEELYKVMSVEYSSEETQQNMDPYLMLYKAARDKLKFQRWIKRFEKFLIEICKTYLRLAKIHMTDEDVLKAWGMDERANLEEWRNSDDLAYSINVEAQADDIETKFGKQMALNHTLQYVGGQLSKDDIGKILRELPYANGTAAFDDLTLDYDLSTDDILALDRGETPPIGQYDNHPYLIKKLTKRMRQRDFRYLSPLIQHNYEMKVQMHQQFETARQLQIQRAEQGFIPTGGYAVTCQVYVTDPGDPSGQKTRLARVPYQSLEWLIQHLNAQGQGQSEIQSMDEGSQAQIASKMAGAPPTMGTMPNAGGRSPLIRHSIGQIPGQGMPQGRTGAAMPTGAMQ